MGRMFRVGDQPGYSASTMPWEMIELHERQALRNHNQTIEGLHERGGLSWCEALAVIEDRPWRKVVDAKARVLMAIESWKAAH